MRCHACDMEASPADITCHHCGAVLDMVHEDTAPARRRILPRRPRPDDGKLWVMGISSRGFVLPGETADCGCRPQLPFKAEGLMISDAIADSFLILAIYIGNMMALQVSPDAIPASVFKVRLEDMSKMDILIGPSGSPVIQVEVNQPASFVHGKSWHFPPVQPGMDVRMMVTNIGPTTHVFRAVFAGIVPPHLHT